jgi:hypothetical protein
MNTMNKILSVLALAAVAAMAQSAWAHTSDATCRFYKNGDKDQKRSGPCTFSQRQGNISIELRSGDTVKLSPRNKADQFKDQKGNKVVRTGIYGSTQVFKWDDNNKKLIVNFNDTNYGKHNQGGYHASGQDGNTPSNLRDLVGARAGQAEDELRSRGYQFKNSSKSGGSSYTNWKQRSTGRCVTVRTADGRYQSIVYVPDADCRS